jgi:hypothetical protein
VNVAAFLEKSENPCVGLPVKAGSLNMMSRAAVGDGSSDLIANERESGNAAWKQIGLPVPQCWCSFSCNSHDLYILVMCKGNSAQGVSFYIYLQIMIMMQIVPTPLIVDLPVTVCKD